MIFCPVCNGVVTHVLRFNGVSSYELFSCHTCHFETTPKKIYLNMYVQRNSRDTNKRKPKRKEMIAKNVRGLHNNNKRTT